MCVRAEDLERSRFIRVSPNRVGTLRNGLWAHDHTRTSLGWQRCARQGRRGRGHRQSANFIPPSYGELVEERAVTSKS